MKNSLLEALIRIIISIMFLVMSFALLVLSRDYAQEPYELVTKGVKVQGEVTEIVIVRSGTEDMGVAPKVRFTTKEGVVHEFKHEISSSNSPFRKGEKVDVLYFPSQPENAKINAFFSLWFIPGIIASIALALFLFGLRILFTSINRISK